MLKSANEIAKVSQEAKQKLKEQDEQKRQSALLMQAERQNFEKVVVDAALAGKGFIVTSQIPLAESNLTNLGFLVERLEKKPERLNYLEKSCSETRIAILSSIGRLHNEKPLVQTILQDDSLEPSSFIPFIEWLWRDGHLKDEKNVDALLGKVKSYRGVDEKWVDMKRYEFVECLELFFKLKYFDSELAQLTMRTLLIPEGTHSTYLVSWEGSEDGGGNIIEFSAPKFKWLSVHWPNLSAILNAKIVAVASNAAAEVELIMNFDGRAWFLDISSTALYRDDPDSMEAGSPNLIEEQLSALGYRVLVQSLNYDDDYDEEVLTPLDLRGSPPKEGDLCRLTVRWP